MDLVVEYNKNDFLYYTTTIDNYNESGSLIKSDSNNPCPVLDTDYAKQDVIDLARELCRNKDLADQLLNRTELHSGSDEMYANTISKHNSERLTTFNLAMGIMVGIIAILKFRT